ncbi:putative transmembrane protein [Clostridium botulinum B str. Eklund 17B (NRP)]|uniref:Transmembrane protein n=1 Tax=Clostridium botulinum (strain Eklund 17B / Type B) TaxID=935198 RepID=B2TL26_CLOBB|nr:putative transmembrane protein [Clostridium botulinum B str. Eklund 17B (NRP)]
MTLFIHPIIGMADNGDFYRVINKSGAYHLNKNSNDIFLGYFIKDYGIYKYNNDYANILISTQSIFVKSAIFLDSFFTKDYVLDIRFMSIMFLIIEAIGVYFFIKALINKVDNSKYKLIITLLTILIFCDTGYLAYYNSFYGESVNICCFLMSIGLLIYMIEFDKFTWYNLIAFGISSFLFFGSKQQLAPVGILISFIFIIIGVYTTNKPLTKILTYILAIIFIISSMVFYKSITGDFKYINIYHSMNRGILLNEDDPDSILEDFNISTQYSLLQETDFFEEIKLLDSYEEKLIDDYYEKFSLGKILEYYITHPKAFIKVLKISFNNGYSIRPKVIGNYEQSEHKEFGAKSYFFATWSTFKEKVIPKNMLFTVATIVIYLYLSTSRFLKAIKNNNKKIQLKEITYFYVFLVGISQIIISVIGAGDADLSKHVFMYNMAFDLIFIYIISLIFENKTIKS